MAKKTGRATVGIGVQYGDEGKIKIFDKVAADADVWVRFNGGGNAGHHLDFPWKRRNVHLVTHGIPSGLGHPRALLYIGSGCVVNAEKNLIEIAEIESLGIPLADRLFISGKASLVQPHHLLFDELFGKEVGTTKNGIGPAYADQAFRQVGSQLKNIRLADYLGNPEVFREHVRANLEGFVEQYHVPGVDIQKRMDNFDTAVRQLAQYCCRDPLFLERLVQQGKNLFFEGANSAPLDEITGDVPFVTASRTLAAAAYTGGDLSLRYHYKTIGVAKAIPSRVGNGPFIAEFGGARSEAYCRELREDGNTRYVEQEERARYDPLELLKSDNPLFIGIALRMLGGEYGATTKRPRRIGRLDLVQLRQSCVLNGVDELYLNKVDCLNEFARSPLPGIPLVVAYELDGNRIDYIPPTVAESRRTQPVVEYMPAFTEDISSVRRERDLPRKARDLLARIEEEVGIPLCGIGVGPKREQYVPLGKK